VKHVISLTMLLATSSLFIAPNSAAAVDVIEMGGYSLTISIPTTTTTTTIDNYPSNNPFYGDRHNSDRNRQDRRQQKVIPQNNVYYPPSNRSNCTTTIIGSPIPSPIPIDRNTGQPCR
jgi:hypothetical protein